MCKSLVTVTVSYYAMQGWCGWKPVSFWDKKVSEVVKLVPVSEGQSVFQAHYNMCMPQRPRGV